VTFTAAPLGTITKLVSPCIAKKPELSRAEYAYAARVRRWQLKALAGELLPGERVSWCCKRLKEKEGTVSLVYSEEYKRAHLKGVIACGSIWTCPVCAQKISARRREELTGGLAGKGFAGILITFTLQHNKGSDLATLVNDLVGAVTFTWKGKAWQQLKAGLQIVGSVSGLETTYGDDNGHHPHKHVLLFSKLPAAELDTDETRQQLKDYLYSRYGKRLAAQGYTVNDHTIDVKTGAPELERYLSKWSLEFEVSRQDLKEGKHPGHYTMFQVLDLIDKGGRDDLKAVFVEYAKVFHGRQQLRYSPGLRALLGLEEQEKSDVELVQETDDESSWTMLTLTGKQFHQLAKHDRAGAIGKLLEIASSGDVVFAWVYLESFGIGRPGFVSTD